ncbi:MAG: Ig-like domain-containing protein [Alistipes sp.]|nr:Ig-like domain-containing protein [Alistipes sp.]MBQ3212309.1 Ig-like domain-containing protein [Alistipes sp.]
MKKHIVKIMMLLAVPALAVVSCDSYDRTEVEPTVTVDHNKVTLFVGESQALKASPATLSFTWESSNPDIATVSADGVVTGKAEGAASVVAKAGDVTFSVEVIVQTKVAITGVKFRDLDGEEYELAVGNTFTTVISQIPSGGNDIPMTDFEWWVDDENVARVSQAGVVKGIGPGSTVLHYRRGPYTIEQSFAVAKSFPHTKGQPFVLSKEAPITWRFSAWDRGGRYAGYEDKSGRNGNTPDVEGNGNIGYTTGGEWLCYTVDVKDAGKYKCTMTASSSAGKGTWGGNYQWFLDKPNVASAAVSPTFQLQSGGGWGGPWMPAETEVTLEAGVQRLIFYMHNGAHNLFDITFEYAE